MRRSDGEWGAHTVDKKIGQLTARNLRRLADFWLVLKKVRSGKEIWALRIVLFVDVHKDSSKFLCMFRFFGDSHFFEKRSESKMNIWGARYNKHTGRRVFSGIASVFA
ncbi:hypothetical protein ACFQ4P_01660 [Lacticaseibacillus mingshuiensis]|uniref:Uncharacterized protein n=1 Tax=Lacticaseibacillus mingshuiensis TaxID=2799574 RepID=A0ABW4CDT2_9LACO